MAWYKKKTYTFLLTIPEHLYPFKNEVDGVLVRGRLSYAASISRWQQKYPSRRMSLWIISYRTFFHVAGSAVILFLAVIIGTLVQVKWLPATILGATVLFITYQEFYLHPRHFHQVWYKGVIDWLAWVFPITLYFLF